jgi:hypothetical protein
VDSARSEEHDVGGLSGPHARGAELFREAPIGHQRREATATMASQAVGVERFTLQVPQATLDDLQERLARARWPDRAGRTGLAGRHQPGLPARAGRLVAQRL